jgi:hypothetical protein
VAQRLVDRDPLAAASQRDDQLYLVMEVIGRDGEGQATAVRYDGGGRLHEEEGRLAVGVVAHLDRVLGVVASDAEDPEHREHGVGPIDRQCHRGRGRDRVPHRSILRHRLVA